MAKQTNRAKVADGVSRCLTVPAATASRTKEEEEQ